MVDAAVEKTGVDGLFAAITIGQRVKAMKRAGIPIERLGVAEWVQVFDRFTDGRIPREAVPAVAQRMAQDELSVNEACSSLGIALRSREQWTSMAEESLTSPRGQNTNGDCDDKRTQFLIGKVVRMLKNQAPASEVAAFIRARLNSEAK